MPQSTAKAWSVSGQPVLTPGKNVGENLCNGRMSSGRSRPILFKMWYSAGDANEPNAIGYATSPDGLNGLKREHQSSFPIKDDLGEHKSRPAR